MVVSAYLKADGVIASEQKAAIDKFSFSVESKLLIDDRFVETDFTAFGSEDEIAVRVDAERMRCRCSLGR